MIEDVTNVLPARTTDDGARPTVLFIGDIGQEFIQLCSEEVRCPELQGLTKVLHVHPSYWQCVSFVTSSSIVCGETQSCAIVSYQFLEALSVFLDMRPLPLPRNPTFRTVRTVPDHLHWFFNRHRTPRRCPLIVPSTPFVRRTTVTHFCPLPNLIVNENQNRSQPPEFDHSCKRNSIFFRPTTNRTKTKCTGPSSVFFFPLPW